MRVLLAIFFVVQSGAASAAVDLSKEGLRVLELLDLQWQRYSDPRYPVLEGYEYKLLFGVLLKVSGSTRGWVEEINRIYSADSGRTVSDRDKRAGRDKINSDLGQALSNKVVLFSEKPMPMTDAELQKYQEAREVFDFAFSINGISKNTVYGNTEIAGVYRKLNLYHLLVEAYMRASYGVFVNPINLFNFYKNLKEQKAMNPNLNLADSKGEFFRSNDALLQTAHEFVEKFGSLMSESYLASHNGLVTSTTTIELSSNRQLSAIARKYKAVVLFLGHGSKSQFGDIASTLEEVDRKVRELNIDYGHGNWLATFGGDSFNPEKPDISHVMKHLNEAGVPILAIQSDVVKGWGGVDKYINYVRYVPTTTVPELGSDGKEILVDGKIKTKIIWGGFVNGKAAGPTATYLGAQFTERANPLLKQVVLIGGGPIALEEVQYANRRGIPITYIAAVTKFPEVNGKYGAVDEWAIKNLPTVNVCRSTF
ncbi:MAG: hypothetical protein KDD37_09350 [Bdellovibrionales bacterium]|nr:hypothetical protein [Bdellovibrionales bacterium]